MSRTVVQELDTAELFSQGTASNSPRRPRRFDDWSNERSRSRGNCTGFAKKTSAILPWRTNAGRWTNAITADVESRANETILLRPNGNQARLVRTVDGLGRPSNWTNMATRGILSCAVRSTQTPTMKKVWQVDSFRQVAHLEANASAARPRVRSSLPMLLAAHFNSCA